MGQSLKSHSKARTSRTRTANDSATWDVAIFPTDLGWFGLAGRGTAVAALTIGHASQADALQSVKKRFTQDEANTADVLTDWNAPLRRRLEGYARGEAERFEDVELLLPAMTEFQAAVVTATRRIPFGETRTYAELSQDAGYPRAARAVGNVMAQNRIPVFIPCHRVVAAGEKLGGFSAPQGVDLKRRMLKLETESTT